MRNDVVLGSGLLLSLCSDMAQRGLKLNYKQKDNRISEFLQIFTRQDTGTCISLVGETQHCKSNAFTEHVCPLLYFQGSLGNWYVYFYFFRLSMSQVSSDIALGCLFNPLTTPPATGEMGLAQLNQPIGALLELPVRFIHHCSCLLYLLGAEVRVGLPYFARPPLDDCIAEHSDDHDKQEVACVHQVQVDEGTVILARKELQRQSQRVTFGTFQLKTNVNGYLEVLLMDSGANLDILVKSL